MIAIIPARGGSKGLPGKNTRSLDGIPLICHSIRAALAADRVTKIIVSTDDLEIASVAKKCGADVPFMRPAELAKDDSMVMDSYFYTIDRIAKETGNPIDSFIALLPTAPLRKSADIDKAVQIFNDKKADSVISVTDAPVPIQWYRRISEGGVLCDYFPDSDAVSNRQKMENAYIPNGAVFVFRTEVLRSTRQYYTERTYPLVMPRERSVDIDQALDFELAEFLLKKQTILNEKTL